MRILTTTFFFECLKQFKPIILCSPNLLLSSDIWIAAKWHALFTPIDYWWAQEVFLSNSNVLSAHQISYKFTHKGEATLSPKLLLNRTCTIISWSRETPGKKKNHYNLMIRLSACDHWHSIDIFNYYSIIFETSGLHRPVHFLYLPCHGPFRQTVSFHKEDLNKDELFSATDILT